MARVTFRIPDTLHTELRDEASRQGVSINTALVVAATKWLTNVHTAEWLKAEHDHKMIKSARKILAKKQTAEAHPHSEDEVGEWAANFVREHRGQKP